MILLDLFSGIGGFHKGLIDAGFNFKKVYFSETDKYAIANYKYNYEDAEYTGAVESVLETGIERPNIITFGSPCQDFSLAGKRKELAGERSSLISQAITLVTRFQPDVFIWENVKGAFSSNNGEDFFAILQAFANIGNYQIEWQLLNTKWLLPQNRERIYLVGRSANKCKREIFPVGQNDKLFGKKNKTEHGQSQAKHCATTLKSTSTMKADDTFIEVPKVAGCLTGGGHSGGLHSDMVVIKQKARGKNKGRMFDVSPTITSNSFEQNNHVFLSEPTHKHGEKRIYKNNAPTIQSRYGTGGDNIPYVNNIRRLTEIECERLQGFPDDWTRFGDFDGKRKEISSTQRYKLLGNAVTVKVVEVVGKRILERTEI